MPYKHILVATDGAGMPLTNSTARLVANAVATRCAACQALAEKT